MKRSALLMTLVVPLLVSSAAQATTFYLGASVGTGELDGRTPELTVDARDTTFKAFAAIGILKYFRIEGGYNDFGTYDGFSGSVPVRSDVTGWSAFGAGVFPVAKRLELFGKIGLFSWEADSRRAGGRQVSKVDGTDSAFGFGVSVSLSRQVWVRVEWEIFDPGPLDRLRMGSIGIGVRFGSRRKHEGSR